jgi:4-carboxymuconolactone decarboxylase
MAKVVYRPGTVKPRNRELVVLGLVSIVNAPYAIYCHRHVGHKAGLTEDQIADAMAGKVPEGLNAEEKLSYRLGRELTTLNGPLSEELWQEVMSTMSKEEFVGIAHTVAGYKWVTLLENCNADPRPWKE